MRDRHQRGSSVSSGAVSQGLFCWQFWPVCPDLGNLTFNQSVTEGVALLNTAVNNQLAL